MRTLTFVSGLLLGSLVLAGCTAGASPTASDDDSSQESDVTAKIGPGKDATDARRPELGGDAKIVRNAKVTLASAVKQTNQAQGPVIEAKFELNDDQQLSLSLYPAGAGLAMDAERNVFQELAGDPTRAPFAGSLEKFEDQEHLTRSARDLTLVQLSRRGVLEAVATLPKGDLAYWAIPTIRDGRAGYGVYYLTPKNLDKYRFVDGAGDEGSGWDVEEIPGGPGDGATDARLPELGEDPGVVLDSRITMAEALDRLEPTYGPAIEAKFEIGDDGKLSLSVYPVKDLGLDAERSTFGELAGDPTAQSFTPGLSTFEVPDVEHLTRSARDLTLVQTAALSLRDAVDMAEWAIPGGFVYWAIPTIRDTRSGYGVWVYGPDHTPYYLFVS